MANDAHALERSFLKNNIFQHKRKIYSISELTAEIKKILEHQYRISKFPLPVMLTLPLKIEMPRLLA